MSEIAEFYRGKNVFITGGTGFMGKVIIEKLLSSCPEIGKIYILMRPKWGKTPTERISEITSLPLFERLKKERSADLSKLVVIEGDTESDLLGIGEKDQKTLEENVHIVFHAAATVRFNAELGQAFTLNVGATLSVIQLCSNLKHLQILVHVSTTFCHIEEKYLEERVYPNYRVDPFDLFKVLKSSDRQAFLSLAEKLKSPHPNTYTFTKRLSEVLLTKFYPQLPIVIVRPSIVFPSVREPMPGWVDNLNGPVALSVAGGKGALRSMYMSGDTTVNFVPVDIAASAMIVVSWKHAISRREPDIPVYNISFCENGTWKEIINIGKKIVVEYPFETLLWYPAGDVTDNFVAHKTKVVMFQWIPAYMIDALLSIFNKKPFMVRIQERIKDGMEQVEYFTTRRDGWHFETDKFRSLPKCLSQTDKVIFNMEPVPKQDMYCFLKDCLLGARQYCLKEKPDSIPICQKRIKYYYAAHRMVQIFFFLLMMWVVFSLLKLTGQTSERTTY